MPYFDVDEDQEQTPAAEAEARRKVLGMIAGAGRTSILGNKQPEAAPTVPPPRMNPMEPPTTMGAPTMANKPPVLGVTPQPVRPNVMPQRSDFPEKPVPTWQKALGIAAAPFLPAVTGALLGGPRREAERKYNQATTDWER